MLGLAATQSTTQQNIEKYSCIEKYRVVLLKNRQQTARHALTEHVVRSSARGWVILTTAAAGNPADSFNLVCSHLIYSITFGFFMRTMNVIINTLNLLVLLLRPRGFVLW